MSTWTQVLDALDTACDPQFEATLNAWLINDLGNPPYAGDPIEGELMRVTCTECDRRVGSYIHTGWDAEGHGIHPVCDSCTGFYVREAVTTSV